MPYETSKHYDFDFDSEWVMEDFTQIAALIGIDLYSRRGTKPGDAIHYSGFWSQGDGASFEGSYRYQAGALKAVMQHAPLAKDLHDIVLRLQTAQRACFYSASARITCEGRYSHENTMRFEFDFTNEKRGHDHYSEAAEDTITETLRDLARWLYRQLESAYEYGASYAMGSYVARKKCEIKATRAELATVLKDYRPIRKAGLTGNSLCDVIQGQIRQMLARVEKLREDIRVTLRDNRTDAAYEAGLSDYSPA